MLSKPSGDYFCAAQSWADDRYEAVRLRSQYYLWSFLAVLGLALLLSIALICLIPLRHIEPLLVNHYTDGRVSVTPLQQSQLVHNEALVESELVRYVINRESYDMTSFHEQYALINLLSSEAVARQYRLAQSIHNKASLINHLGNTSYRSVHIDSVVFLDRKGKRKNKHDSYNLAQVNFVITDHDKTTEQKKTQPLTALISWRYVGVPTSLDDRWRNWDGFVVSRYSVQQRNAKVSIRTVK